MLNINAKIWEETEVKDFGGFEKLELGGHSCVIKKVEIHNNEMKGTQSLKVSVDIATPDKQAGFFQKQYDSNPNLLKKWSNGATRYYSLKEEHLSMLKGFVTAVEKSNMGFKFNMDETTLVGKKIAGVFGLEEYQKEDGTIGTATKLVNIRSLDKLHEIQIPKVKLLNGSFVDYDDYIELQEEKQTQTAEEYFGKQILETDPGEMPFEL